MDVLLGKFQKFSEQLFFWNNECPEIAFFLEHQ